MTNLVEKYVIDKKLWVFKKTTKKIYAILSLQMDEKIILLLQYERFLIKMGKVELEYNSIAELNEAYGKGKNYVQELRKQLFERGTINWEPGSGRKSLEVEKKEVIFETVRKDRSMSIREIVSETSLTFGTVWRALDESKMRLRSLRSKPLITEAHKEQRLRFVQ